MTQLPQIQQHYYTRARQGIFRATEGLDSVAKSPALEDAFIKKTLHPFCVYLPPHELSQRGEQDYSLYPESLTVFHAESGELVIGRSIMAGADFTGQRDTIFVHHYIVPSKRKEDYLVSGNGIFRIRYFENRFDGSQGQQLPALDDIPFDTDSYIDGQAAVLERLGIDTDRLQQLLWAVMAAISSNKKVYVALNVDVSESATYAKRLTEILFHLLPYELRRHFGFSTYQNEPQPKKYLNLIFVEKGSIRPGERSLDKDYLFDFAGNRFANVDLHGGDHYFLDLAIAFREHPELLAAFFSFAEEALEGCEQAKAMSYTTYNELSALFRISKGKHEVYETNKEGVLTSILGYLKTGGPSSKRQLRQLFEKLVSSEMEAMRTRGSVSAGYAAIMVEYAGKADTRTRQMLIRDLALILHSNWNTQGDEDFTAAVMDSLQQQPDLFAEVIRQLQSQTKYIRVLEDYILARLAPVIDVKGIIEEIVFWNEAAPSVLEEAYFPKQCGAKIAQVLGKDRSRIGNGEKLCHLMDELVAVNPALLDLTELVKQTVAHAVLGSLDAAKLTIEEAGRLDYLIHYAGEPRSKLASPHSQIVKIAAAAAFVWDTKVNELEEMEQTLNKLDEDLFDKVQALLRRQLKGRVEETNYTAVAGAFYIQGFTSGEPEYDYSAMLAYVGHNTGNDEDVFHFLLWLSGAVEVDHRFAGGVRQYFREHNPEALRNKKRVSLLNESSSKEFRKLIQEIERKQLPGYKRFLREQKKLLILLALFLIGAFLTVSIIWIWMDSRHSGDNAEPSPTPSTEATPADTSVPSATPSGETPGASGTPDGGVLPEGEGEAEGSESGGSIDQNGGTGGTDGGAATGSTGTNGGTGGGATPGTTGTEGASGAGTPAATPGTNGASGAGMPTATPGTNGASGAGAPTATP